MAIVIAIDPLEAILIKIIAPKSWLIFIEFIQVINHALQALMGLILQQTPLQIPPDVPFRTLGEFHAHEDGFLAWMGPHVGQQGPDVGELLPVISWHFLEEITLAMHHFIMAQCQHKVFSEGIPNRKGDIILMKLPEPGIKFEIIKHVMHPTHVPLQVEAQPTNLGRLGDHRPGGGFFGD